MDPRPERCALTPIQESEESQSSADLLHSEPSPAGSPGTPIGRPSQSPDDRLCSSPQRPEMGDCEDELPSASGVGDSSSPTAPQLEHIGKSAHDPVHSVLNQQPIAVPAVSPPHETAWPQTNKRRSEANREAEGQKRPKKQRGPSTPPEPSLPLWLVSLMHNIEEATHHELVIE